MPEEARRLSVGRILKPHGVRGEVKVYPLTDFPEIRYAPGRSLLTESGSVLTVEAARPHQDTYLVKFKEIADHTAAESYSGLDLLISASEASELPPDTHWIHTIVGLRARTPDGRSLGMVREVLRGGANDVYVVESPSGRDILVPATKEAVELVDPDAGELVINLLPGLLDEGEL